MWMFPLMLAYMCFYCGDLDSVQVAFIKIAQGFVALFKYRTYISTCFWHYHFFPYILFHSVCIVYTSIYWFVRVMGNADVIGFIIIAVR
jgi:hypothetical protein